MTLHAESKEGDCAGCGTAVAVRVLDDETASPIGRRGDCSCGSDDFRIPCR